MVKKIYILLACTCVLFLPTSCSSWLDLQPQDGLVQSKFWKNKEQVATAVTGCYAQVIGLGLPEKMVLAGEIRADMLEVANRIKQDEAQIMDYNILATNSLVQWSDYYTVINACNSVIEFAPSVLDVDATYTQAAMKADVAQAKALRAWMYYYLVRLFKDVPIKLNATNADADFTPLAKSPQADVLAQIEKDLLESETDIPATYGSVDSNHARVTKGMVNTLQADVYLWMEKPQEALVAVNKVISSGKYGLSTSFASIFNGNSVEGIFELAHGFDITSTYTDATSPLYSMFGNANGTVGAGTRRFTASDYVLQAVLPEDGTSPDIVYDLRNAATYNSTSLVITKYARGTSTSTFNFVVYRLADALLFKAEALALLDRGPEALAIVNQIRTRATAISATEQIVNQADKEAVLDYILAERSREFAYEGKRWFDLLRHAKRNNYKRLDILISSLSRSISGTRLQSASAKAKDPNSHYLPIYQRELNTNKLLVQNSFYK